MSNRVFVGNLTWGATKEELSAEMSSLGLTPKDVVVVIDRATGRGKGAAR